MSGLRGSLLITCLSKIYVIIVGQVKSLQESYPVISISFAGIKENTYEMAVYRMRGIIQELFIKHYHLINSEVLTDGEKKQFKKLADEMPVQDAPVALNKLSGYLSRYYNRKVIILMDEYDTPMQEAYVNDYWNDLAVFTRSLFNSTFKTNAYLERGIMTGITRVGKESIFSDLNNLKVVTTTSDEYADLFGFTEAEVFAAMNEQGKTKRDEVKRWYNGFTFGNKSDIYNPWSILNYLDTGKFAAYWANTSSNSLINKLIQESSQDVKIVMEDLLQEKSFRSAIDEQVIFDQLGYRVSTLWSLLLASGYLKIEHYDFNRVNGKMEYDLKLTNLEVCFMFRQMIDNWFLEYTPHYNHFVQALLAGNVKEMNIYMNKVALDTISYFDTGSRPSGQEPERFYHGLVLGLLVELKGRYVVTSNRESGYGRYDVMLEPLNSHDTAIIIEFKVHNAQEERSLPETVAAALRQIEEKEYGRILIERGISPENIRKYGFAFEGKKVLIG